MISTGIRRVDSLFQGGVPEGSNVLVYGPPFLGKETLTSLIAAHALNSGTPVIWVTTKEIEDDVQERLRELGAKDQSLLRIVDTLSRSLQADQSDTSVEFVDSGMDLNGIAVAIGKIEAGLLANHQHHLLVIDSLSTLVAYTKPPTVFRFLQILLGRSNRAGATNFILMDHGMHTDAEMKMFKHIMTGSVEFSLKSNVPSIHAEGMAIRGNTGFVEYEYTDTTFDVTGLFSTERIL